MKTSTSLSLSLSLAIQRVQITPFRIVMFELKLEFKHKE